MSISAPDERPTDNRDIFGGCTVALIAFFVYRATVDASLAGLSSPDAPPRAIDETGTIEYLTRASSMIRWPAVSSLASAIAVFLTFRTARILGAGRRAAIAAALGFAFGRGIWSQAVLPGLESVLALLAAAGLACALEWERSKRTRWLGSALMLLALSVGWPEFHSTMAGHSLFAWTFVELNAFSLSLGLYGAGLLVRERRSQATVLAAVLFAMLVAVPVRGASSLHAALIPIFPAIWPSVAVGTSRLARWFGWRRGELAIAAMVAIAPLAANLPWIVLDQTPLARWHVDRLAEKTRGCRAVLGLSRDDSVPDPADLGRVTNGCEPFVFGGARNALEHLGYRFENVLLQGPLLGEYLRLLPRGYTVGIAVPPAERPGLIHAHAMVPVPIGPTPRLPASERDAYAVVGRIGDPSSAIESSGTTADVLRPIQRGQPRLPIRAQSFGGVASIAFGAADVVRTTAVALAAVTPEGQVSAIHELDGPELRVPFDRGRFGLARLLRRLDCTELGGGWTDVTDLATQGRVGIRLSGGADNAVVLYAGRDLSLDPWIPASWAALAAALETRTFRRDDRASADALAAALEADAILAVERPSAGFVYRITVAGGAASHGMLLTSLDLSGIPSVLLARTHDPTRSAAICPAPRGEGYFGDPEIRRESVGGRRSSYGDGWGAMTRINGRLSRVLDRPEGELLVGLARVLPIDVSVAVPVVTSGTLTLRINGSTLPLQRLVANERAYRWTVPATAWRPGVNQIFVVGQPGLAIGDIDLVARR